MIEKSRRFAAATLTAGLIVTGAAVVSVTPAQAHTTGIHDNCTKFNKKYPHGVGKRGARDRGGNVTNFKRSTPIYNKAERHNGTLDRDNDGVACEKK